MRMDLNSRLSAKEVINTYSENDLANIFYNYGDLKNSRKVTQVILEARNKHPINTTKGLTDLISGLAPKHKRNQFLARVFQSIRIEVNDEVIALKEMLNSAVRLLNNNGRLVIISYHSLEDRIVKNLIKKGNTEGHIQKDFFGNHKRILKEVNKKVITPTDKEIEQNPRARSAKLRIAEKV